MSPIDGVWRLWREVPGPFPQRYTGTFSDDGKTITGGWERAEEGSNRETDFDSAYRGCAGRRPAGPRPTLARSRGSPGKVCPVPRSPPLRACPRPSRARHCSCTGNEGVFGLISIVVRPALLAQGAKAGDTGSLHCRPRPSKASPAGGTQMLVEEGEDPPPCVLGGGVVVVEAGYGEH
jgi:hypothetical protein